METITKAELARLMGVSKSMISKHTKNGVFTNSMTPDGKKLYKAKAIKAIENYTTRPSMTKREQHKPKNLIPKDRELKAGISSNELDTESNIAELELLLIGVEAPKQRVDVIDTFWKGKLNKLKYYEALKVIIPMQEAKAVVEMIFAPLNRYLDDLPNSLMAHFPDTVTTELMEWLQDENERIKGDIRRISDRQSI